MYLAHHLSCECDRFICPALKPYIHRIRISRPDRLKPASSALRIQHECQHKPLPGVLRTGHVYVDCEANDSINRSFS